MKKSLLILFIIFSLCGCSQNQEIKSNPNEELKEIILENNYIILDVRSKEEYDEGHLKDALNIPYDEINIETTLDKEKTILVYCASGNRSGIAYKTLSSLGYDVYDLGAYESITLPKE